MKYTSCSTCGKKEWINKFEVFCSACSSNQRKVAKKITEFGIENFITLCTSLIKLSGKKSCVQD